MAIRVNACKQKRREGVVLSQPKTTKPDWDEAQIIVHYCAAM